MHFFKKRDEENSEENKTVKTSKIWKSKRFIGFINLVIDDCGQCSRNKFAKPEFGNIFNLKMYSFEEHEHHRFAEFDKWGRSFTLP